LADWKKYYEVYEDSLLRWGDKASSRYELRLFEEMQRRNSPNIKLWLAAYQEKIIAGALCFYAKKHVVWWHGASLEKHFRLRPNTLIIYEAIKDACERGFSWFDFNPSGGHEGVTSFKKRFGTQAYPSNLLIKHSLVYKTMNILMKGFGFTKNRLGFI
jgi:lipid II:glycine glycyltransferase (peptidoglycan interpeptide bridge formation enzyme)